MEVIIKTEEEREDKIEEVMKQRGWRGKGDKREEETEWRESLFLNFEASYDNHQLIPRTGP